MVALIIFGPRKLPMMAKKAGKFIREMRSVSNDFRSTWEREVSFEEGDETDGIKPLESNNPIPPDETIKNEPEKLDSDTDSDKKILPEVREVSEEEYKRLTESKNTAPDVSVDDKQNWL